MFQQIHIVACSPRTGTTLLHEAMVTCFKVDKHYDHEVRFNQSTAERSQVLVTKRPKDTYYMSKVLGNTPGLHTIYLLRDPRDAIVSRHGKDKSKFYSNIPLWRDLHAHGKALQGFDNCLVIRYEDFVTNPDACQKRIQQKFPWLKKLHDFSAYHEHAKVSEGSSQALNGVRPISPASIGLWKKNLGRVKAQQALHGSLTPELIECGYETSADWEVQLNAIPADTTSSYYHEKKSVLSRLLLKLHGVQKVASFKRLRKNIV
ncbi:MAG: sulfotransferase [Glaciecola sp.]